MIITRSYAKNGTTSKIQLKRLAPTFRVWKGDVEGAMRFFPAALLAIQECEQVLEQLIESKKPFVDDFLLAVLFALGMVEGIAGECVYNFVYKYPINYGPDPLIRVDLPFFREAPCSTSWLRFF
jgi:hypothetical protein